jgi:hypothetical protein
MKVVAVAWLVALVVLKVNGQNDDQFNYRDTNDRDYGPNEWNKVSCNDLDQCVSSLLLKQQ